MIRYRPLGRRCPECRAKLHYEDHDGWVYIECPECGHRWVKDWPDYIARLGK